VLLDRDTTVAPDGVTILTTATVEVVAVVLAVLAETQIIVAVLQVVPAV
jgi:hypothetical protein